MSRALFHHVRKLNGAVIAILITAALDASPARAQGGPPLITDDPDTPGPGYWEINVASALRRYRDSQSLDLPRIDANYGVGRRIQLKLEAPWVRIGDEQTVRTGMGNAEAGVKYRFLGSEGQFLSWSVYPQIEFSAPRRSVRSGAGEGARALLLPTEVTVEKAHVELNFEVGRRFAQDGESAWAYGVSTEAHVLSGLELLAEVHAEAPADQPHEVIVNIGARPQLTKQMILLLSVGRAVQGSVAERPRLIAYAGLQFNLPGLYKFGQPEGR